MQPELTHLQAPHGDPACLKAKVCVGEGENASNEETCQNSTYRQGTCRRSILPVSVTLLS